MHYKEKLIALGASTGGVDALEQILGGFTADIPSCVIVIHLSIGILSKILSLSNVRQNIHKGGSNESQKQGKLHQAV